jgi:NAD(P)-dependent dehydrogenase (short-subunit alcohol dehydrogenase family)
MVEALKDKVALITGAGRGLGAEVCKTLREAGARVVCTDIHEDLAREVAQAIDGSGARALALRLDVSRWGEVQRAVDRAVETFGQLDIVVNNAGTDVTVSVEELPVADWDRIIATNLSGPFLMSKAAMPVMKRQGAGHIVNVVSTAAKRVWPNASAYHASKWGLLGLSHALHTEARSYNIKVTAVVSGGMRTPFLLERFPDIDVSTLQDPKNVAETIRFVLTLPKETVIPEIMVLPMSETSWP